jgi:threonyl-tRNA synthetase
MKILTLHCDYIRFQALKKAIKDAPELKNKEMEEVKECLVVLTAIEKGDGEKELHEMISAVKKTAGEVKAKNVVLYPYALVHFFVLGAEELLAMSCVRYRFWNGVGYSTS